MNDVVVQAQQAAAALKARITRLDDDALDLLLREARTHNGWLDKPVADEQLHELYELMKWGPTSANSSPSRIVFVRSAEAKERLKPALSEGNLAKTMSAPVTAIIAFDVRFWTHLPKLFPHQDMRGPFMNNPTAAEVAAFRNGTLQGGYFILAARALGLDIGAMSGFDAEKVYDACFANTSFKTNFLCNIGYGDTTAIFQRSPRFAFSEVCEII